MTLSYAERQLRYFQAKVAQLRQTSDASDTKENEGEKRTPPLDPPIEKRAKQEKAAAAAACVREEKEPESLAATPKNHPTLAQVEEHAKTLGATSDFAKWWYDEFDNNQHWISPSDNLYLRNWKRTFQMYWKMRYEFGPVPEAEPKEKKPKVYKREDWALCEERCRFFDTAKGVCTHGYRVPPDRDTWKHSPEQCKKFEKK